MQASITDTSIRLVTALPGPRSIELEKRRKASVARGVGSVLPVFSDAQIAEGRGVLEEAIAEACQG